MKKLIAYIALAVCISNSCTTQTAVHFDFKKSLVRASSVALNRLSRISVGHGIKRGSCIVKSGFSTTYSVFSYMLTGKMKWATLAIALYIYAAVKMAKTDREMIRKSENLVPLPVEPITPIHLPETMSPSLPLATNLPPHAVVLPVNTVQQVYLPGAGLGFTDQESAEIAADIAARRVEQNYTQLLVAL